MIKTRVCKSCGKETAGVKSCFECGVLNPKYQPPVQQAQEPYLVKAYSYGGITGINDYLMSDGSIMAMTPDEAKAHATPAPVQQESVAWAYHHDGCMDPPIVSKTKWTSCDEPWTEEEIKQSQERPKG